MKKKITILIACLVTIYSANAQSLESKNDSIPENEDKNEILGIPKKWFKNLSLRGYMQVRYNGLLETNNDLGCEQCDKSWGGDSNGFFLRRGRIVLSGNVTDRISIYIQPDFASSASSTNNILQLRDAYFDVTLDTKKEFRIRVGQSKVPYGFENLQSSQNRLALDRNDGLNSAVSNERDLGMTFYWAPAGKRALFSKLVKDGLKGSGDYGVFGLGVYNGQTANRPEANKNKHIVARVSYPFELKRNQVLELGLQGYTGNYIVNSISSDVITKPNAEYLDQRVAGSIILYPKPFGFQAEYNIGTGPEFNTQNNTIEQKNLSGGYAQVFYKLDLKKQTVLPFVKYQMYRGGKKHELDARSYSVNDLEIGFEWQFFNNLEIVADYTISNRRYEDAVNLNNLQKGNLLRLQMQLSF